MIVIRTNNLIIEAEKCLEQQRYTKLKEIKHFLGFCFETGLVVQDFRPLIPSRKRFSRTEIPSVYASSEILQLLEYVKRFSSQNTKRNYAIILLIATYGLRASDVFAMKISDIDWDSEKIYIVQSKTGVALTHRLTSRAAAALTDYLLNERKDSGSVRLFLQADGSDIGSAVTISTMICHAFSNSGIAINGRKHGSHCLRHSLASNMLANNAGLLAVSQALGHESVDSTKIYSKVDVNRLRICELEVPAYE